ncbi:unnamed protein product, partial [Gulo gulo]
MCICRNPSKSQIKIMEEWEMTDFPNWLPTVFQNSLGNDVFLFEFQVQNKNGLLQCGILKIGSWGRNPEACGLETHTVRYSYRKTHPA